MYQLPQDEMIKPVTPIDPVTGKPIPIGTAKPLNYAQVAGSPFTLSSAWLKVVTTTSASRGLRLGPFGGSPSAYDIEWCSYPAGTYSNASPPPDAAGEGVLAGEDFLGGIPIGDVFARSPTSQPLIVKLGTE